MLEEQDPTDEELLIKEYVATELFIRKCRYCD